MCLIPRHPYPQFPLSRPSLIVHNPDHEITANRRPEKDFARPGGADITIIDKPEQMPHVGVGDGVEWNLIRFQGFAAATVNKTGNGRLDDGRSAGGAPEIEVTVGLEKGWSFEGDAGLTEDPLQIRRPEFEHPHFGESGLRTASAQARPGIHRYGAVDGGYFDGRNAGDEPGIACARAIAAGEVAGVGTHGNLF